MKSVGTRFLLPFGVIILLLSIFMLYRAQEASREHAQQLLSRQAAIALEFNLAIRDYVGKVIRPEIVRTMGTDYFMPETMSTSYISRRIFEKVRQQFPDHIIRFASDNPRNPVNTAGPDEMTVINYFRGNRDETRITRVVRIQGRRYLAHFRPRFIRKECLRCHGEPGDAPAGLIRRYGAKASFHQKVGDIAGLDTVAVPLDAIDVALYRELYRQWLIITVVLLLLFSAVMAVFRQVVSKRLGAMSKHFQDIAEHPESSMMVPVNIAGKDEIAVLGSSFNRLLEKLGDSHATLERRVSERTGELTRVNEQLKREITERTLAEEAIRENEERFRALVQNLEDFIVVLDEDGRVRYENPVTPRKLGYSMIGKNVFDVIHPEDKPIAFTGLGRVIHRENLNIPIAFRVKCADGSWLYVESLSSNLSDNRYVNGILSICRDITTRKEAEEALAQSLEENQGLLRELQHRVKNSLAIITGLIGIEANRLDDPAANEALTNIRNRVNSLSRLYDQLYSTNEVDEVLLDSYLEQIARSLVDTYTSPERKIDLKTELAPVKIDVKRSISIGLILNELLTNALKYAFRDLPGGTIRVVLQKNDGGMIIEVADDGVGLPPGFSLKESGGRGMEIVQMLLASVCGEMEITRGDETVFRLTVPE